MSESELAYLQRRVRELDAQVLVLEGLAPQIRELQQENDRLRERLAMQDRTLRRYEDEQRR